MRDAILVLSESLTVRKHLAEVFSSSGFRVRESSSLTEAKELLSRTRIALALVENKYAGALAVPTLIISKESDSTKLLSKAREMTGAHDAPHLLIVDDSYTFRAELGERFRSEGFEVVLAERAAEIQPILANNRIDVILLDLILPDVTGDKICKRLRDDPKLKNIPVILITAQEDQATLVRCFDAGADDFIAKSSDFEVIRARVSAQLRRKRVEDENRRMAAALSRKSVEAAQAQRMRELYEQARKAVEVRDEFLSIASHELKTPLTSLKIRIQGLQRVAQKEKTAVPLDRLVPVLENADKQIMRLTKQIEDLLEVSRIHGQTFSYDFQPTDLVAVVRDAVAMLEPDAKAQGCKLSLNVEAPRIQGRWDSQKISQAVVNLIANAIKYGPKNPVEISVSTTSDGARVSVVDHGIGISTEDQGRIFKRFERAVPASHFGGLGLGLYITEEIVRGHGGRIWVKSQPGKGASFFIDLPWDSALNRTKIA